MHFTPVSFWLMIVSTTMAVLPGARSPMISWRWPRPIGVMASIALMPVCSGSCTGWRSTTEGAWVSRRRRSVVSIGPLPSIGLPSGSITRPSRASPTGTDSTRPVCSHRIAFLDVAGLAHDHGADRVLVEVEGDPEQAAGELQQLRGHGAGKARDAGDTVADGGHVADGLGLQRRRPVRRGCGAAPR